MPFVQRYSDVKKGAIIFAGNTLGLSKAANSNSPGTEGSIGAFTSLNTSLQVGNFPAGTTLDYTLNGSRAQLSLPAGSSVLYAELVWGGLYRSTVNNISNLINNPVVFSTPLSANVQIAPDAATSQDFVITVDNVTVGFYVRSANVTALVAAALSGAYSVQRVPALIEAIDSRTSQTNHAGWTLAVVYENQTLDLRNLTLWSGGNVVSPSTGSTTVTVTNFLTPGVLPITGKVFVSAQEGDAVLTGDRMLFGQTVATLGTLSGPNNPAGNFFASQINDQNGLLDTTGTFGTRNANAAAGTNTVACRQGWDTTAVDVSATLAPAQTSAVIRFTSDGDLYVPNALGLQIDSKGADLAVLKTADKTFASVGDEITYSVKIDKFGRGFRSQRRGKRLSAARNVACRRLRFSRRKPVCQRTARFHSGNCGGRLLRGGLYRKSKLFARPKSRAEYGACRLSILPLCGLSGFGFCGFQPNVRCHYSGKHAGA